MSSLLKGGCFCGAVRYEAGGAPFNESACHCSMCRRTTGAPFVAWFSVRRSMFRLSGPATRFRSSAKAVRSFCPVCGTQVSFEHDDCPDEIDVSTASLDDPAGLPPKDHIHTASKLPWLQLADGLPQFPGQRAGG
jgi:hypothetical protein